MIRFAMRKVLLTFMALALVVSGFGQEPALSLGEEESMSGNQKSTDIVRGVVRIKLIPEASPLPVGSFPCGEPQTGNRELDAVLARIGAVGISRVFDDGGKFAERRRRYGLHLWYEIAIRETVPVADAIEALGATDIIEYAVPVYRMRISQSDLADGEYDPGAVER